VIWRVEGRVSLDVQEIEETNERCSRHGARRGDLGGMSGVLDCGDISVECSGAIWTSILGDPGGVGSERAVTSTVTSCLMICVAVEFRKPGGRGFRAILCSSSGQVRRLGGAGSSAIRAERRASCE